MTPSLSCLKEFSQLYIRGTQITSTFTKVSWTSVFFTSAVEWEEVSIYSHVVTLHTQNPCFGIVNSAVIIMGPTPTNSCFIDLPCVFHCHRRSRRRSINASARRCRQSAHLWPFLPRLRHSPSKLAGLFLSVVFLVFSLLWPLPLP